MGACFGLIFGMLDVEDFVGLELRDALVKEERKCIPVGIVLGAAAALFNEQMAGDRDPSPEQRGFSRVPTRDFDDEGLQKKEWLRNSGIPEATGVAVVVVFVTVLKTSCTVDLEITYYYI